MLHTQLNCCLGFFFLKKCNTESSTVLLAYRQVNTLRKNISHQRPEGPKLLTCVQSPAMCFKLFPQHHRLTQRSCESIKGYRRAQIKDNRKQKIQADPG
jgi:hypothetical protein